MFSTKLVQGLCIFTLMCPLVGAAEKEGVTLPDTANVAGKTLKLNGIGTRRATFLKVKVYHAGLYVENPSSEPQQILDSNEAKQVRMHFVHDAPKDKMIKAWDEARENNCPGDCANLKPAYDQLNSYMVDVKTGDVVVITLLPKQVELELNGQKKPAIQAEGFSKVLLATWLGPKPPNKDLKEGMLGKK